MPQILVRNLDDRAVKRLKRLAEEKGLSFQAEVKTILEESDRRANNREAFFQAADQIRRRLKGRRISDSSLLVREDRDR